jgi:hypothetical protein
MQPNQFVTLFSDSFDSFKVFDNLSIDETTPTGAPKTAWQILNHLIAWQQYQLEILNGSASFEIDEQTTWITEAYAATQEQLNDSVLHFYGLIEEVKGQIANFDIMDAAIGQKIKTVQDLAMHLSFHVGEMVLMRRMTGCYPMPHEMSTFLKQ